MPLNAATLLVLINLLCFTSAIAQPTITSFSPTAATQGTSVTITGTNFTGATAVTFGGIAATSFIVNSPTTITAVAPAANSGIIDIAVTTPSGTASRSGLSFNKHSITSITPVSGLRGASVTINGTGFNVAGNQVYFGNVKSNITSASSTTITATVPASVNYKPITLIQNGLTANSSLPFAQQFFGGVGSGFDSTSFGPSANIATGSVQTLADFDGDGKQDLATLSINSPVLSVYKNQSSTANISFNNKTTYATGTGPRDVTTGDFNADGKIDIAVLNYTSKTISIFQNTSTAGTISFNAKVDFSTGNSFSSEPSVFAVSDVDNDGKLDIVVSLFATSFIVMRNTSSASTISFTASPVISYNNNYGGHTKLVVAEFDGDGKPDVGIMTLYYSGILVFKNQSTPGTIAFATKIELPYGVVSNNGAAIRDIATADLDGDGKMDLVAVYSEQTFVSVLRNTSTSGNISFATFQTFALDYGAKDVAVADLDGDGKVDLVASGGYTVSVFKNISSTGALSFASRSTYIPIPFPTNSQITIFPVDVDGDDKPEIIMGNEDFNYGQFVNCIRNHVNGPLITYFTPLVADEGSTITIHGSRFTTVSAVGIGGIPASTFTIVNDSTITAVVPATTTGQISVTSPGGYAILVGYKFSAPIPVINSISPASGVAGTVITISGEKFSSSGNKVIIGGVKALVTSESTNSITAVVPASAAYNHVMVSTANSLNAFALHPFDLSFNDAGTGLGTTSFADKTNYSIQYLPWDIASTDLDGDGRQDIMTSIYNGTSRISVFRNASNYGNIVFEPRQDFNTYTINAGSAAKVTSADLDGDGKPEMVAATSGKDSINIFRNTSNPGAILFAPRKDYKTAQYVNDLAINDVDNDGKFDIVTANASGYISVLRNQSTAGNISFASKLDFSANPGAIPQFVVCTDFDGDKKADVVCANNTSNNLSVFQNRSLRGIVQFASPVAMPVGISIYDVAAADLDGDGKKEMLVVTNSNFLYVYPNTSTPGSISFAAKIDVPIVTAAGYIAFGDMDGNGKPDIILANYNNVSVIRNLSTAGSFSFANAIAYSHNLDPVAVTVADFNGDNKPDMAVGNRYGNNITVFKNGIGETSITTCSGSPLNSNLTGSSFQWYRSTDSVNYVPVSNDANHVGATSATLQLQNMNSSWSGNRYKCITNTGASSNIFNISYTVNWIGGVSSNWTDAGNWSCGIVPDINTDVVINSGTVVISANSTCRTLKLNPGVSFTVKPGVTLTILR